MEGTSQEGFLASSCCMHVGSESVSSISLCQCLPFKEIKCSTYYLNGRYLLKEISEAKSVTPEMAIERKKEKKKKREEKKRKKRKVVNINSGILTRPGQMGLLTKQNKNKTWKMLNSSSFPS